MSNKTALMNSTNKENMKAAQAAPAARLHVKHPYMVLMGLYMGGFTGMYSETALNIALPDLSKAFGAAASLTQWLVIGYMLVIGIVLPFSSIVMKWFTATSMTIFAPCSDVEWRKIIRKIISAHACKRMGTFC